MRQLLPTILLIFLAALPKILAESGVNILAGNLEQVLTSSTLKWVPADKYTKKIEYAVVGGSEIMHG